MCDWYFFSLLLKRSLINTTLCVTMFCIVSILLSTINSILNLHLCSLWTFKHFTVEKSNFMMGMPKKNATNVVMVRHLSIVLKSHSFHLFVIISSNIIDLVLFLLRNSPMSWTFLSCSYFWKLFTRWMWKHMQKASTFKHKISMCKVWRKYM